VLGISTTAGQQPIDWIESITFALFKRDIYNDWKIEPSEVTYASVVLLFI
jgi:hypothetical protein